MPNPNLALWKQPSKANQSGQKHELVGSVYNMFSSLKWKISSSICQRNIRDEDRLGRRPRMAWM